MHSRFAAALLLLFTLFAAYSITESNSYTPDSARYAVWASSLSQGDGFADRTNPEPSRYVVHAPLYPIVLTPFAWFSGITPYALKFGSLFLAVLMLFRFHRFLEGQTPGLPALAALALFAFNPLTLHYSTQLLSDPLFILLLITLFALLHRLAEDAFADMKLMTAMVSVLAAGVLTREIGMVLLPVVLLFLLMHKRYDLAGWTFVGVVLVYGTWYVRNEIIVAGTEHPELQNSLLFTGNILTSGRSAFLQEIIARFSVNTAFYLRELPGLIFFPQFSLSGEMQPTFYTVVDRSSWLIAIAQRMVAPGFLLAAFAGACLMIVGGIMEYRKGRLLTVYAAFLPAYCGMLLLYPVTDIRFLFPVLIVMLILLARGLQFLGERWQGKVLQGSYAFLVIAMLPNLLWAASFVKEAAEYRTGTSDGRVAESSSGTTLAEYTVSFNLVAEWFRANGLQPDVIIAKRKEFGLVLPGTKVVLLNGFSGLAVFEQTIRDYDVRYIISGKDRFGWYDFEPQLNLSGTNSFRVAGSAGGYDIIEVLPKEGEKRTLQSNNIIRYLFHHFERGDFAQLRPFFRSGPVAAVSHPMFRYYDAVTLECLGELDSARLLFSSLLGMPQGVGLTQQIGFHMSVLDQLSELRQTADSARRADILFNIALNYWELDMRTTALRYLNATVMQQRSYIPAYNLFIHFSLQTGDTVNARGAYSVLSRDYPAEPAVAAFGELFGLFDADRSARTPAGRGEIAERIAAVYAQLGLSDARIASLRRAASLQPERESAILTLAALYQERNRFYPALLILTRALEQRPDSPQIRSTLTSVRDRY